MVRVAKALLGHLITSKSHTNAMFTNNPPPLHAPQAAARLDEGACTFVTAKLTPARQSIPLNSHPGLPSIFNISMKPY